MLVSMLGTPVPDLTTVYFQCLIRAAYRGIYCLAILVDTSTKIVQLLETILVEPLAKLHAPSSNFASDDRWLRWIQP